MIRYSRKSHISSYRSSCITNGKRSINSKAAFFILKAGARHVSDGGKLISIGTALLAAFTGNYTSYAGSKAPLEHFTRGLAKELLGRGISVNCVAPGPMDTRMLAFLSIVLSIATAILANSDKTLAFFYPQENEGSIAYLKSGAIGGRLTEVGDIAPVIKFLVTEGAWISGQTIFANGGFSTR